MSKQPPLKKTPREMLNSLLKLEKLMNAKRKEINARYHRHVLNGTGEQLVKPARNNRWAMANYYNNRRFREPNLATYTNKNFIKAVRNMDKLFRNYDNLVDHYHMARIKYRQQLNFKNNMPKGGGFYNTKYFHNPGWYLYVTKINNNRSVTNNSFTKLKKLKIAPKLKLEKGPTYKGKYYVRAKFTNDTHMVNKGLTNKLAKMVEINNMFRPPGTYGPNNKGGSEYLKAALNFKTSPSRNAAKRIVREAISRAVRNNNKPASKTNNRPYNRSFPTRRTHPNVWNSIPTLPRNFRKPIYALV